MNKKNSIGTKIKILMKYRGLEQSDLSKLLNVNKSTVSRYCNDTRIPPICTLRQLSEILNCRLEVFLGCDILCDNNNYISEKKSVLSIGERIGLIIDALNLNQEYVAKEIGVAKSTLSKYVNNYCYPTYEALEKMSKVFNCSISYILGIKYNSDALSDESFLLNLYNEESGKIHQDICDNDETIELVVNNVKSNVSIASLQNFIYMLEDLGIPVSKHIVEGELMY